MQYGRVRARSQIRTVAVHVVALAVALISCWAVPSRSPGQDQQPPQRGEGGHIWYDKYCTPCHGPGGAPGTAVFPDSKQPVDLRTYVQRHGGQFPRGDWLAVVFGDPVRNTHGVVWGKIRSDEGGTTPGSETVARGIIATIADYVISIQAK